MDMRSRDMAETGQCQIGFRHAKAQAIFPQMGQKPAHSGGRAGIAPRKSGYAAHAARPASRCATSRVIWA